MTDNRDFPLLRFLKALWHYLCESAGENDYEHYRLRALACGESPVQPAAFYLACLERKYSRPNRCC
jgi:Selenoprotein, putative